MEAKNKKHTRAVRLCIIPWWWLSLTKLQLWRWGWMIPSKLEAGEYSFTPGESRALTRELCKWGYSSICTIVNGSVEHPAFKENPDKEVGNRKSWWEVWEGRDDEGRDAFAGVFSKSFEVQFWKKRGKKIKGNTLKIIFQPGLDFWFVCLTKTDWQANGDLLEIP